MQKRFLSILLTLALCISASAQNPNTKITPDSEYFEGTHQASYVSGFSGAISLLFYSFSGMISLFKCGSPDGSDPKRVGLVGFLAWLVHFGSSTATAIEGRMFLDSVDETNENESIDGTQTGWWLNIAGKIATPALALSIFSGIRHFSPNSKEEELCNQIITGTLWTTFLSEIPSTIGDSMIRSSLSEIAD